MRKTTKIIVGSFAVMAAVGAGSAAFAANQAPAPKVTQEQAVKIAQTQVPGATVTDSEHDDGRWEVELLKGQVEHDVEIDDQNGKVLRNDTDTADTAEAADDANETEDDD